MIDVDKIAKKLYVFKGTNGEVIESFQPYTEYLEIEKEIRELGELQKELGPQSQEITQPKQKNKSQKKLSYNDQRAYNTLPDEIEALEEQIESINNCLMDPKCYEQKGIVAVSQELETVEKIYEEKVEKYLELEELVESFNS